MVNNARAQARNPKAFPLVFALIQQWRTTDGRGQQLIYVQNQKNVGENLNAEVKLKANQVSNKGQGCDRDFCKQNISNFINELMSKVAP